MLCTCMSCMEGGSMPVTSDRGLLRQAPSREMMDREGGRLEAVSV